MSIANAPLTKPDSISKGFNKIKGIKQYLICTKDRKVICFFYAGDAGNTLINHYLKNNRIAEESIRLENKLLKNDSNELANMLHKKIVILDKKVVVYEDVVKLSHSTDIKGYTEGNLKNNINVFNTL